MPAKKTDVKKATPASEWKATEPELVELPSGNMALLKRPNMYVLMKTGQIPAEILGTMENGEASTYAERQFAMEWQIATAFVEPEVSVTEEDGKLCIDQIEDMDKGFVAEYIGIG